MGRPKINEKRMSHYGEERTAGHSSWDYRVIDQEDRNQFFQGKPEIINRKSPKTRSNHQHQPWFLPRLCRTFAEKILLSNRKQIGSFFIRSSQSKFGYALSLRIAPARVGHFFISVAQCNATTSYKIWNTEFCSLESLVDYFVHMPIYENIKLHVTKIKYPIARTTYACRANSEWELDCSSNQRVTIIATVDRDWHIGMISKPKFNQIGLVPRNFLELENPGTPARMPKTNLTRMDSVGATAADNDLIQF
jgi:hypothetical protein